MHRAKHRVAFTGLSLLLAWSASVGQSTTGTPPPITHEVIEQSWQKREQAVRTFKITWDEDYTVAKGSFLDGKANNRKNPGGKLVPAEQVTYKTSYTLTVDGDRMRYQTDQIWLSHDQTLTRQSGILVSTKDGSKRLLQPGTTPYPRGVLSDDGFERADVNDPVRFPILVTFRPKSPLIDRFKDFATRFEIVPGRVPVEGRECIQVKQISTDPGQTITTAWLDPEREFVVVRLTRSQDGKLMSQYSFQEFRQSEFGWIPIRWTTTFLTGEGTVDTAETAVVREFEVNKPVPESEFEVTFPEGTWVTDVRGGTENQYIIKPGGEQRKVLVDELVNQAKYEQLLTTNTGEALRKPTERTWGLRFGIGVTLALLTVVGYLGYRRKTWLTSAPEATPESAPNASPQ